MKIADLRQEYTQRGFDETDAAPDPITQFRRWFDDALQAGVPEPNGMTLATATPEGAPSARIVLLKDADERGFVFYTNYNSRKGQELAANPQAALVFWWEPLARQVRIEGTVEPVPSAMSDAYFASRPRGSRVGAWASPQSAVIAGRDVLERNQETVEARYDGDIPRPPHWGGYRLVPSVIEFWQGRASRLHDRLRYRLSGDGSWERDRLAP